MRLNWKRRLAALCGLLAMMVGQAQGQEIELTGCTPSCSAACDQGEMGDTPDIDTSAMASNFGSSAGPESANPHMIGDVIVKLGNFSQVSTRAGTRSNKYSENQSAAPTDRFYYNYSYFDNVGGFGSGGPIVNIGRHTFGREWLLGDGNSSFGFRVPFWTVDRGLGTTFGSGTADRGAFGDLGLIFKHALINNGGDVLTVGAGYTAPTGSSNIAGVTPTVATTLQHDGTIQPFIGGIRQLGRGVFFQSFLAFDVPIDDTDAVLMFLDMQLGYYASTGASSGLTALIPVFELHSNNPVGNRVLESGETYLDTVNSTTGITAVFNNRSSLTTALVAPVGDNRVFDYELQVQYNVFGGLFGGR